jgi:hypothetical protein
MTFHRFLQWDDALFAAADTLQGAFRQIQIFQIL